LERTQAASVAAFSLSEVTLTMAHVAARVARRRDGGPDLVPTFRELFARLDEVTTGVISDAEPDVRAYSESVSRQCIELIGNGANNEQYAH
jgi:hypothetical protein